MANLLYGMKDRAAPAVIDAKREFDTWATKKTELATEVAEKLFHKGQNESAVKVLSTLAVETSGNATSRWTELFQQMMIRFSDGVSDSTIDENNLLCGCRKERTAFTEAWGEKVIRDTRDHYRLPSSSCTFIDSDGKCHKKPPEQQGISDVDSTTDRAAKKLEVYGIGL